MAEQLSFVSPCSGSLQANSHTSLRATVGIGGYMFMHRDESYAEGNTVANTSVQSSGFQVGSDVYYGVQGAPSGY